MGSPETWEEAKRLLEAALFAAGEPLSASELSRITGLTAPALEKAVSELNEELEGHAFYIERVEDGWIMVLRRDFEERVHHLFRRTLLSRAEMRTLAIIAANQPVTMTELVSARGSSAREHVKKLLRLGLIRETREGRKRIFRTTKKFSVLFRLVREGKEVDGDTED